MKRSRLKRGKGLSRGKGLRRGKGFTKRSRFKRKQKLSGRKEEYRVEVWKHTFANLHLVGPHPPGLFAPDGTRWTIDHIIPIYHGRTHDIPAKVIGSAANLRWISHQENMEKGQRVYLPEQFELAERLGYPIQRPSDLQL